MSSTEQRCVRLISTEHRTHWDGPCTLPSLHPAERRLLLHVYVRSVISQTVFYCINDVGECTFCIFKLKKMKSNWKKQVLKTPETSLYTPLINVDFFCPRPCPPLLPARLSFWMRPLLSCSCVSGLSWLLHACVLSRRVCSYDWLHGSHCPLQAE